MCACIFPFPSISITLSSPNINIPGQLPSFQGFSRQLGSCQLLLRQQLLQLPRALLQASRVRGVHHVDQALPCQRGPGHGWGMAGGWVGFGGKTWETCGKNIPWNGKMMSMSSIFLGHRKSMKVFTPEMATLVHYKTGKKPPWESLLAGAKFDFRGPPQFRVPGASVFSK